MIHSFAITNYLSPIGSLQGALSIPVGGGLDCDIYEGEYNIVPSDTVQVLPTANKLLKHDIVIEANSGGLPEGSEMATDDDRQLRLTSTVRSVVWAPWQARVRSPTTIWLRL